MKYGITKAVWDKGQEKFNRDLWFSPRKRAKLKESSLKLLKSCQTIWPQMTSPDFPQDQRENYVQFTAIASKLLDLVKQSEQFEKDRELRNCRFWLYRNAQGKSPKILFLQKFFKVFEHRTKYGTFVFPAGLPTPKHPLRRAQLWRCKLPTKSFRLVDQGRFIQKVTDSYELKYWFLGKKHKLRFLMKASKNNTNQFRVTALKPLPSLMRSS